MASTKSRSRLFLSIIIFSFGIGVFFMMRGCTSDVSPIMSNLLLEKNGKRYLLTMQATDAVEELVAEGKTPAVSSATFIYKDGDEVYMSPLGLSQLVAVLRASYTIHPMKDGSVDGYLTTDPDTGLTVKNEFKSSQNLGEQHQAFTVTLENKKGKKKLIRWTFNPKESSYYGMKNCEIHGFWTETRPSPGETVWSTTDYLVVSVSSLAEFFHAKIEFDEESELLIIQP